MGANVESAQFDPVVARNRGFKWENSQWNPFGLSGELAKNDIGYSAVSNSASFVQCCDRSKIKEPYRILSPLRRELLDSLTNLGVSVDSVLKGLFPLGFLKQF